MTLGPTAPTKTHTNASLDFICSTPKPETILPTLLYTFNVIPHVSRVVVEVTSDSHTCIDTQRSRVAKVHLRESQAGGVLQPRLSVKLRSPGSLAPEGPNGPHGQMGTRVGLSFMTKAVLLHTGERRSSQEMLLGQLAVHVSMKSGPSSHYTPKPSQQNRAVKGERQNHEAVRK